MIDNLDLPLRLLGFATFLSGALIGAILETEMDAVNKVSSLERRIAQLEKENKR